MKDNNEFKKEVIPQFGTKDATTTMAFKTGFIACIKAVEDNSNDKVLIDKLKYIIQLI